MDINLKNFKEEYSGTQVLSLYFSRNHLLYGWILPSIDDSNLHTVFKSDIKPNSLKMISITFVLSADDVISFFDSLISGNSLENAAIGVNIPLPNNLNNDIKNWLMPIDDFLLRPTITNITSNSNDNLFHSHSYNTEHLESLFNMNQNILFEIFNEKNILALENETGINFSGSQRARLGNIEWFKIPFGTIYGQSKIKWDTIRTKISHRTISSKEIKLECHDLEIGKYAVNVRFVNANAIISDTLKTFEIVTEKENYVSSFMAEDEISSVSIKVWNIDDSSIHQLVYEEHTHLMREMSISINVNPVTYSVESDRIKRIEKQNPLVGLKLKEVTRVNQGSHSQNKINIKNTDPWRNYINEVKSRTTDNIDKKPCESYFFEKGFAGDIKFIEWIKSLSSNSKGSINNLYIVDPYIDNEVFSLLVYIPSAAYVLLTNTEKKEDKEQRLIGYARRTEKTLHDKIELYDFKDNNKRLHDRYIIIEYKSKKLEGYNLSNSIQSGSINYPLLVTKICNDTLDTILEWLHYTTNSCDLTELLFPEIEIEQEDGILESTPIVNNYPTLSKNNILKNLGDNITWEELAKNAYNNNETLFNLQDITKQLKITQLDYIYNEVKEYMYAEDTESVEVTTILEIIKENDIFKLCNYISGASYYRNTYKLKPTIKLMIEIMTSLSTQYIESILTKIIDDIKHDKIQDRAQYELILICFLKEVNLNVYSSMKKDTRIVYTNPDSPVVLQIATIVNVIDTFLRKNLDEKELLKQIKEGVSSNLLTYVLCYTIYKIRVIDNQKNVNNYSENQYLPILFLELAKTIQCTGWIIPLEQVYKHVNGPINDTWAIDTYNKFILVLLEYSILSEKEIYGFFVNRFLDILEKVVIGLSEFKQLKEIMTTLCLYDEFKIEFEKLITLNITKNKRRVIKPFSQKIHYKEFSNAQIKLHYLIVMYSSINNSNPKETTTIYLNNLINELKEKGFFCNTFHDDFNSYIEFQVSNNLSSV